MRLAVEPEPHASEAVELLFNNRRALVEKFGLPDALYTPPSPDHYPHIYLWDSCFSAIVFARHGYSRQAVTELFSVVDKQLPSGMVPNMQFSPQGRNHDPERFSFMHPALHSDYTQPPVLALAVAETHKAMYEENNPNTELFLSEIYPKLRKFYGYFDTPARQNGTDDLLIGVIHPHETGRDSDPTFDRWKLRLPRKGPGTHELIDRVNRASDYASVLMLNLRLRLKNWDPEKVRQIFWVNDVMFNCMYVDNLYQMGYLASAGGHQQDAEYYQSLAAQTEAQILDKMWFRDEGKFYALDKDGQPIKKTSISNLFPLILPNLRPDQLARSLDLIADSFKTDYPLPSVSTRSLDYDPKNQETDRLWRGPTWINTNWYLVERGLRMQAQRPDLSPYPHLSVTCTNFANEIAASSKALTEQGHYEFYNPHTGQPQRTARVSHFAWSTLSSLM